MTNGLKYEFHFGYKSSFSSDIIIRYFFAKKKKLFSENSKQFEPLLKG